MAATTGSYNCTLYLHLLLLYLKFYGPRIGALYVRRPGQKTPLYPMFYGGGQERSFRPGSVHVASCMLLCIAMPDWSFALLVSIGLF